MPTRRELILGAAGLTLAPLAGCGGGSKSIGAGSGGRATFVIHWPPPSRLIPSASMSVLVAVTDLNGGAIPGVTSNPPNGVVSRDPNQPNQTSTISFSGLPVSRNSQTKN